MIAALSKPLVAEDSQSKSELAADHKHEFIQLLRLSCYHNCHVTHDEEDRLLRRAHDLHIDVAEALQLIHSIAHEYDGSVQCKVDEHCCRELFKDYQIQGVITRSNFEKVCDLYRQLCNDAISISICEVKRRLKHIVLRQ